MPYANIERSKLVRRGATRTTRHGNWRQTYIDCFGVCVARVNGSEIPCCSTEFLELHEEWGEGKDGSQDKFQHRMLLCNMHHSLVEDGTHQAALIVDQYKPSRLSEDVSLEMLMAGGYHNWIKKHNLDDSRSGQYLFQGPHVDDYGDG